MNNTEQIHADLQEFISLSKKYSSTQPYIVVLLMHEYFRTLYPDDPYIEKRYSVDHLDNISACLKNNIKILSACNDMGSYYESNNCSLDDFNGDYENIEGLSRTQTLFGQLWKERKRQNVLDSTKVLIDSFKMNGFNIEEIKGKNVLDMGCGSGRFTLALASIGAKHVTGVDLGEEGLQLGMEMAKSNKLNNVTFEKHSVLELPYDDESFDFVFCKGVLHHTGNLNKGLKEYFRIMKRGGKGFLYLYGSGGIFWKSRKLMREVMSSIPIDYTMQVLNLIGMPARRTIFVDSWYVPIEEHVKSVEVESTLQKLGFSNLQRWTKGRSIALESMVFNNVKDAEIIWGEGELRYIVEK